MVKHKKKHPEFCLENPSGLENVYFLGDWDLMSRDVQTICRKRKRKEGDLQQNMSVYCVYWVGLYTYPLVRCT